MFTHTSPPQKHLTFTSILTITLLIVQMRMANSQPSLKEYECLWETPMGKDCIDKINIESLIKNNPQISLYACPMLAKFYENTQQRSAVSFEKVNKVCRISTQYSQDNGYLLFGLYLLENKNIQALKLEYNLFFNDPFNHQSKLQQALTNYNKYLIANMQAKGESVQPTDLLSKAIKQFYLGQYKKALQTLQGRKQGYGEQQLGRYELFLKARLLQKDNQFPTALQLIKQNIIDKKGNVHWYVYHLKGNMLMHHLKFRAAIASFDQAMRAKNPMEQFFIFSLYNAGLCYQKLNEHTNALKYLRKAMLVNPASPEVLNAIGFSYYSLMVASSNKSQQKQYAKTAQQYYEKAINNNKKYFLAYHNYGMLQLDRNNYTSALQLFKKSVQNNPNSASSTKYGLMKAQYMIDKAKGLQYLQNQILKGSDHSLVEVGQILHQLGESKLAKQYLQKAIQQKSNLGLAYQWKGMIEFQMDLLQEAAHSFTKALHNGNTVSQVWFNLGYIEQLNKNYDKAMGLYKKSLEKDSSGPGKQRLEQIKKIVQKGNKNQQL